MKIRIGTRNSKLAIIQAKMVAAAIIKNFPDYECVLVPIVTSGDKITDKNLYDIGGKALFLKELEIALLKGEVDIAVHSLKDVPGRLDDGLSIEAVLAREDPRDCFVSFKYKSIDQLPKGAIIGTSSVRRKVILQNIRPDLKFVGLRGNINTRIEKLKHGEMDATILACAGLKRGEIYDESYCFPIDVSVMLPAACQGIVTVEIKSDNQKMRDICKEINHVDSWNISLAERAFLHYLDASCRTPISAYAVLGGNNKISCKYMLSDFEGSFMKYHTEIGNLDDAWDIGIRAAIRVSKKI